jgi:hypothetical protein
VLPMLPKESAESMPHEAGLDLMDLEVSECFSVFSSAPRLLYVLEALGCLHRVYSDVS